MEDIKVNVIHQKLEVTTRTLKTDEDGKVGVILGNGIKVRVTPKELFGASDEPVVIVKDDGVYNALKQMLEAEHDPSWLRRCRAFFSGRRSHH
jgi:hypothetical protein